eukprot:jgi/Hompol1/4412/HPOL_003657-RA
MEKPESASSASSANSAVLQFESWSSAVEATFWQALGTNKINVYRLDDADVSISGFYSSGDSPLSSNTSADADAALVLPARLCVSASSFDAHEASIKLGTAIQDPSLLNQFTLLTFADLKKYKFYFWFAFPAILPSEPVTLDRPARSLKAAFGEEMIEPLVLAYSDFRSRSASPGFFLVKQTAQKQYQIADLADYQSLSSSGGKIMFGFVDPSGLPENPGWPLRNLLALIATCWSLKSATILCLRESSKNRADLSGSIVLDVTLPSYPDEPKYVGWEKGTQGKPSPRVADLAPLMDPKRLAESAVDLNLKLMRWRILPELQLQAISQTKCLLLGAGTLGCYVARLLMAWGVRHITFVDNGKVSFSNPVRQPLFKFSDCLDGGRSKAQAAAEALTEVFPGVTSSGHDISIPMPGHSIQSESIIDKEITRLEDLMQSHDAVFLLTDSRESRWLPSLLGASMGKIVLNAALGFDSFLVMRHGMRGTNPYSNTELDGDGKAPVQLGCYFCNDVVAPTDSLTDRTLDQQCTVTRPGLSGIASALIVEMLSSIINHPHGPWAAATSETSTASGGSVLGAMPHQIRGFLGQFSNLLVMGHAFEKCPACSINVIQAYQKQGHAFLLKALASPKYLEELSGLAELQKQSDAIDLDWAGDDEDDGDDE